MSTCALAADFKFNTRKMKDGERAALIAKGIEGKRLTYRPTTCPV
jgi:hypothetical protein